MQATWCLGPLRVLSECSPVAKAHDCHLPAGREWFRIVDSSLLAPEDICESDEDAQVITGESYVMSPYSCIVLRSFDDLSEAQRYNTAELSKSYLDQETVVKPCETYLRLNCSYYIVYRNKLYNIIQF